MPHQTWSSCYKSRTRPKSQSISNRWNLNWKERTKSRRPRRRLRSCQLTQALQSKPSMHTYRWVSLVKRVINARSVRSRRWRRRLFGAIRRQHHQRARLPRLANSTESLIRLTNKQDYIYFCTHNKFFYLNKKKDIKLIQTSIYCSLSMTEKQVTHSQGTLAQVQKFVVCCIVWKVAWL